MTCFFESLREAADQSGSANPRPPLFIILSRLFFFFFYLQGGEGGGEPDQTAAVALMQYFISLLPDRPELGLKRNKQNKQNITVVLYLEGDSH